MREEMKLIIKNLERLQIRLNKPGFSWQHDDYFFFQDFLLEIIETLKDVGGDGQCPHCDDPDCHWLLHG